MTFKQDLRVLSESIRNVFAPSPTATKSTPVLCCSSSLYLGETTSGSGSSSSRSPLWVIIRRSEQQNKTKEMIQFSSQDSGSWGGEILCRAILLHFVSVRSNPTEWCRVTHKLPKSFRKSCSSYTPLYGNKLAR